MTEVYLPPQTVIKPRQATCTVHDLMIDNDHALGNHIGHIDARSFPLGRTSIPFAHRPGIMTVGGAFWTCLSS